MEILDSINMDTPHIRKTPAIIDETGMSSLDTASEVAPAAESQALKTSWLNWYAALKAIWPLYIAIHLAFVVTTVLALLFTVKDFSSQFLPLRTLWQSWYRWDAGNYLR